MGARNRYDVVIVGAGVGGASAAYHLTKADLHVLVLEQFPKLAHGHGSSRGGPRRIGLLDLAAGTRLLRAWEGWLVLEKERLQSLESHQEALLHVVGEVMVVSLLPFGVILFGLLRLWQLTRWLASNAVPCTLTFLWHKTALERELPSCFKLRWSACGVKYKEAAMLNTGPALAYMLDEAVRHGAIIQTSCTVTAIAPRPEAVEVTTTNGTFCAEHVVLATGGWSGKLLAGLGAEVKTRLSKFTCPTYVVHTIPQLQASEGCPIFNFMSEGIYGFPACPENPTLAIRATLPDRMDDDPSTAGEECLPSRSVAVVQQFVGSCLPDVARKAMHTYSCFYPGLSIEASDDFRAVIDFVPHTHRRVVVAAGFDSYGFKYGSIIGEEILTVIGGGAPPAGLEWHRKAAENPLLRTLHTLIDAVLRRVNRRVSAVENGVPSAASALQHAACTPASSMTMARSVDRATTYPKSTVRSTTLHAPPSTMTVRMDRWPVLVSLVALSAGGLRSCESRQATLLAYGVLWLVYSMGSEVVARRGMSSLKHARQLAVIWASHALLCFALPAVAMCCARLFDGPLLQSSYAEPLLPEMRLPVAPLLAVLLALAATCLRMSVLMLCRESRVYDRRMLGGLFHTQPAQLMSDGAFAYMRHPGYAAHILHGLSGSVLLVGSAPSMLAAIVMCAHLCLLLVVFHASAAEEEEALLNDANLGSAYREYMLKVRNRFTPCWRFCLA